MASFQCVANNLRESFRVLAQGRPRGRVLELPGVSVASLGVAFQMFNAAFLSEPIESESVLQERLGAAQDFFSAAGLRWSFWICEDWLMTTAVRRKLSRACDSVGLRLSSELPGLKAEQLAMPSRAMPPMEARRVDSESTLQDFRAIGATCFHVPVAWFCEVFDQSITAGGPFVCWVGYRDGEPVATAATVFAEGAIGVYNVATMPGWRRRGYGEAITRHAIDAAGHEHGCARVVLQSTSEGLGLYQRIGFEPVTRVLVYNSMP